MNPDEPDDLGEPLAELIAAFDANLAAGGEAEGGPEPDLPPDQLRLYRLARASLQHMERAWPRSAPSGEGVRKEDTPSFDLLTGEGRVGKFQIRRELGRGGSGVVFLATDTDTGRDVALKLPRLEALLDPDLKDRFVREARFTIGLDHIGLVPVYEAGEIGAVCYIASAYGGDTTLASWLETLPEVVPFRTAAAVVANLAHAVDYLHEHNVLHRDIKPSNILLGPVHSQAIPDPDLAVTGVPQLTDFGLAKLLDNTPRVSVQCETTGGLILGTAEYMAPEQADGRPELLCRSTDVYSLGVVLYELITGHTPFRGRNKFDTLRKVLGEPPPPARRLRQDVPRDLEAVCLKCLEKKPHGRYATAGELAADLHRYLAGQPTVARATPWWHRAWRWVRKRPGAASFLLLAGLSPVVVIASGYLVDRGVRRERAEGLRNALFSADVANLLPVVQRLRDHLPFVEGELRQVADDEGGSRSDRLRAALVLAPGADSSASHLLQRSLDCTPEELRLICEALGRRREECFRDWECVLLDPAAERGRRLRAACALAQLYPGAELWPGVGRVAADLLVAESATTVVSWSRLLDPVKERLLPRLGALYADLRIQAPVRALNAAILAEYRDGDFPELVRYLREADVQQFHYFFAKLQADPPVAIPLLERSLAEPPPAQSDEEAKERFSRGQANLALALMRLGTIAPALDRLEVRPDSRLRSRLLQGMRPYRIDLAALVRGLRTTAIDSVRSALLLAMGDYPLEEVAEPVRIGMEQEVGRLYRNHPDPGVHSAAGWLLARWKVTPQARQSLQQATARGSRWYTTTEGHTLAIVAPPGATFVHQPRERIDGGHADMAEWEGRGGAGGRAAVVAPFSIATFETTIEQFRRFADDQVATRKDVARHLSRFASNRPVRGDLLLEPSCPVSDVSFTLAAAYCNWLSERERLPTSEWCYDIVVAEGAPNARVRAVFLDRTGYRLPTESEWIYACRAGTTTAWFFGENQDLISEYCWHYGNSDGRPWQVGRKRPNPFGLFDVYGNVCEWCQSSWDGSPRENEVLMSGGWRSRAHAHRSDRWTPAHRSFFGDSVGFRVARASRGHDGTDLRSDVGADRVGRFERWFLKPIWRWQR